MLPLLSPYARDEVLFQAVLDLRPTIVTPARRTEVKAVSAPTAAGSRTIADGEGLDVYVFPGQGAQAKGMGRELFDRFPELVARADAILGYSLRELCLDDPDRNLRNTEYTQPALYVVNALTWLATLQEGGRLPDYLLGHSLGEFAALFASGVYDFDTGLRLVAERGRLMGRVSGGMMAAVSAIDADLVQRVLDDADLSEVDIANYNAPTQTVIAGPAEAINRALALFKAEGARCAPLNVSAPFHSRYMATAAAEFGRLLDVTTFSAPKIPVISNVDARPYRADGVADTMRRQIVSPVRWTDSVRLLMGLGEFRVRELGPGQVLTKLVARIREEATPTRQEPSRAVPVQRRTTPDALGSAAFRRDYGVRHAYAAGGMHHGVSSVELVSRLARARLLGYFGAAGLTVADVAAAVGRIRDAVPTGAPFGVNVTHDPFDPRAEADLVDVLVREDVRFVEAATYVEVTAPLVRHRLTGARLLPDGTVHAPASFWPRSPASTPPASSSRPHPAPSCNGWSTKVYSPRRRRRPASGSPWPTTSARSVTRPTTPTRARCRPCCPRYAGCVRSWAVSPTRYASGEGEASVLRSRRRRRSYSARTSSSPVPSTCARPRAG